MAKKLDLTGLSTEEISQINSVLARNEAIQSKEQKRIKWLKYRTFGTKGEKDFLGKSGEWFHNRSLAAKEYLNGTEEKSLVPFGHSKHRLNSLPLITPLANRLSSVVSETIVTKNAILEKLPQKPPRVASTNPFNASFEEKSEAHKKPEATEKPKARPEAKPEAKPEARPELERRQGKRWEPAEPIIDAKIITVNKVRKKIQLDDHLKNKIIQMDDAGSSKSDYPISLPSPSSRTDKDDSLHYNQEGVDLKEIIETLDSKLSPRIHRNVPSVESGARELAPRAPPRPSLRSKNENDLNGSIQNKSPINTIEKNNQFENLKNSENSEDFGNFENSEDQKTQRKTEEEGLKNKTEEEMIGNNEDEAAKMEIYSNPKTVSGPLDMRDEIDVQDSISNIESQSGSGASSQSESFGEISFTMKFDLEITNKDGTNRLLINVINCRKIPRIPLVSHPYIKVYLMPDKVKRKTQVATNKNRQREPEFNTYLDFPLNIIEAPSKFLHFQVWDLNPMGKNRLLSGIQVALDQIDTFTLPRYYPLTSASNFNSIQRPANLSFRGTIKFAFRYMKKEKQLDCVAIQGENLALFAKWPFLKVFIFPGERGKQKSPTSNKPDPQNPTFNHLFSFNSMKKEIMKKSGLHISVFNMESIKGNKLIGNNRIGPRTCLPLPLSVAGKLSPENEIWESILNNTDKWNYFDVELNLEKFTDQNLSS